MSKSGYPYAPDEFDQPLPHGAPAGVHRTQRSGWRKTWPFLLVMVVFAGLGLGGFYWLNHRSTDVPTAQQTTQSSPAASAAETTSQEGETQPSEEPTPSEDASPTGTVDKAATVRVLNGAGITGLAAKGAEKLETAGYTAVTADDYKGVVLSANTIYYKTPEMEATAKDIAAQFGIPVDAEHVQLVPENQAQVSVILMTDFN